jgi:hypothetical protein
VHWIWRLPERGQPDALRLRRLSRWVALRVSAALAVTAVVLGVLGASGAAAAWAAWLAPVPLLLDLALWRVLPRPLRLAVRTAGLAEETWRLNAQMGSWGTKLEFDPELGHAGRPVPEESAPAPAEFGEACQAAPLPRLLAEAAGSDRPVPEFAGWLQFAKVRWTGHALVLVAAGGRLVEAPLTDPGPGPRSGRRPAGSSMPGRPTELVLLRERRPGGAQSLEVRVLLLDGSGRRLLTMPGLGMDESQLRKVALAARLAYSRHTFLLPREAPGFGLAARLFPPRRGHVRLGGPVTVGGGPTGWNGPAGTTTSNGTAATTRNTAITGTDEDIDRLTR